MPRKRIKSKKKLIIDYTKLTDELFESICKKASMSELIGNYKHLGYKYGYYFKMFDANNFKVCNEIWDMHKEEVMKRWKLDKNNAGKRPFLWWVCERPEEIKIIRYDKYTDLQGNPEPLEMWPDGHIETEYPVYEGETAYLRRLNILEDWEIDVFDSDEICYRDEENESCPY